MSTSTDELYYHETACQLQWAMRNFVEACIKSGRSRKDICKTFAIKSCLAMILDVPDCPDEDYLKKGEVMRNTKQSTKKCNHAAYTLEFVGSGHDENNHLVFMYRCPGCGGLLLKE